MAFLLHHTKDGSVPAWEYPPMNAATYLVGDALVFVSGYLTTVSSGSGQDTDEGPHYICMANATVAADGAVNVPVVKANPNLVWQTTLGEASTSTIAAGLTYGVHTDGRQSDSIVTRGCFTIETFTGTTVGSIVTGVLV